MEDDAHRIKCPGTVSKHWMTEKRIPPRDNGCSAGVQDWWLWTSGVGVLHSSDLQIKFPVSFPHSAIVNSVLGGGIPDTWKLNLWEIGHLPMIYL